MKKYIDTGVYKMTNDEIKEALNCCRLYDSVDCLKCPLIKNKGYGCRYKLLTYASILITKQEREIERLRTTLGQCNTELNSALESLKSQCREIGELKAKIKQAQIDILKRLKVFSEPYPNSWHIYVIDVYHIDELIKGVENGKDKG